MRELWMKLFTFKLRVKTIIMVIVLGIVGVFIVVSAMMSNKDATPIASTEVIETEAVETTEAETEEVTEKVEYISKTLGFQVALPELLSEKMTVTEEEREAYGEIITTVFVYYEGEEGQANVLSFEEMSQEVWDKVQEEGGPLGRELGVSKKGRVVVLNTIQSNPYKEGSEDFKVLQDLPRQLTVIDETFTFIE